MPSWAQDPLSSFGSAPSSVHSMPSATLPPRGFIPYPLLAPAAAYMSGAGPTRFSSSRATTAGGRLSSLWPNSDLAETQSFQVWLIKGFTTTRSAWLSNMGGYLQASQAGVRRTIVIRKTCQCQMFSSPRLPASPWRSLALDCARADAIGVVSGATGVLPCDNNYSPNRQSATIVLSCRPRVSCTSPIRTPLSSQSRTFLEGEKGLNVETGLVLGYSEEVVGDGIHLVVSVFCSSGPARASIRSEG
ncbi:hypothetical protein F4778DRAFT_717521 [Xylariomycetidae sp. FL2044]|nr:hypothetical protein F4778DRAFT_717521 [Xylariomycetidae sp. FL2044]